jgi:hypothetical protein
MLGCFCPGTVCGPTPLLNDVMYRDVPLTREIHCKRPLGAYAAVKHGRSHILWTAVSFMALRFLVVAPSALYHIGIFLILNSFRDCVNPKTKTASVV